MPVRIDGRFTFGTVGERPMLYVEERKAGQRRVISAAKRQIQATRPRCSSN